MAVIVVNAGHDLWAFRAEDPDKNVAGRVWLTKAAIAFPGGEQPRLGERPL